MNIEGIGRPLQKLTAKLQRIGIAANHGGFELKEFLAEKLHEFDFQAIDSGDGQLKSDDDDPDFVIALARAVAASGSRYGHLRQRHCGKQSCKRSDWIDEIFPHIKASRAMA